MGSMPYFKVPEIIGLSCTVQSFIAIRTLGEKLWPNIAVLSKLDFQKSLLYEVTGGNQVDVYRQQQVIVLMLFDDVSIDFNDFV